jgi:hypothetical protein
MVEVEGTTTTTTTATAPETDAVVNTTTVKAAPLKAKTAKAKVAVRPIAVKPAVTDSLSGALTSPGDSLVVDSVAPEHYGVVLTPDVRQGKQSLPHHMEGSEASWVILALMLLFMAVCLKAGKSAKYFQILARDLTDTRRRNNVFDDTVRETTFLFILNILSLISGGVLLFFGVGGRDFLLQGRDLTLGILLCVGVVLLYGGVMWCLYWVSGMVFSDKASTRIWVRGYAAAQALLGMLLFPLSLIVMFYPLFCQQLMIVALSLFGISKIVFIWKGFRIFSHQPSSLMLFLYYLCTVELIPLIIVYISARFLCLALL